MNHNFSWLFIVIHNNWCILSIIVFLIYLIILNVIKMVMRIGEERYGNHTAGTTKTLNELCEAIEKDDIITCINILTEHPTIVNKFNLDGYTPFMIACARARTQIVKLMLENGALINLKSKNHGGESPLYLTAFYYIKNQDYLNASCLRELHRAGADLNQPILTKPYCLYLIQTAAIFGHLPLTKWLLKRNVNLNVIPHPYDLAKFHGHLDTAWLIKKYSNCNAQSSVN